MSIFFREFLKTPKKVSALRPLPSQVIDEIIIKIKSGKILELWAGTGTITEKLLKKTNQEIIICENNPKFIKILQKKFWSQKNCKILAKNAEEIWTEIWENEITTIINTLPVWLFSEQKRQKLREMLDRILDENGKMISAQYSKMSHKSQEKYFRKIETQKIPTKIRPTYLAVREKKN